MLTGQTDLKRRRNNAQPSAGPGTDQALLGSVLGIALLTAVLHVAAATMLRSSFWGLHLYGFFPAAILVLATVGLVVMCGFVLTRREAVVAWSGRYLDNTLLARPTVSVAILVLVAAVVFWFLRISHTYLGDGTVLVHSIAAGDSFHPREPLTMIIQHHLYKIVGPLFATGEKPDTEIARDAIAIGSVVSGIVFVFIARFLAGEVALLNQEESEDEADTRTTSFLLWLVILTQGYILLFFGYVENYTFYTSAVALYLWLSLRYLRGAAPLYLVALAIVLSLAFHLSAVVLAPSFIALFVYGLLQADRRRGAIIGIAIAVGAVIALQTGLAAIQPGYSLFAAVREVTGLVAVGNYEGIEGYAFSTRHVRDFFNEQWLIGPLGLYLLIPAAVTVLAAKRWRHAAAVFLILAGLAYLVASWVAGDSNLGYARNWDLLAVGGLVFTVTALGLFSFRARGKLRSLNPGLLCALLISLYHTVPWIAVNASSDRALARLETLPLGLGRTEVLVSQWYRYHGNDPERLRWLHKAIEAYPGNNNAYHLLGIYYTEKGDPRSAAHAYRVAVELRPDKLAFRHLLIDALTQIGAFEEALPHFEYSLEHDPTSAKRWMLYWRALKETGRDEQASAALAKAASMYAASADANPNDYESNLTCGWLVYNLGDLQRSLTYYGAAIRANPNSDVPHCLMGESLRHLGRNSEAIEQFRRCFVLNPNRADRPQIEAWIEQFTK